MRRKFFEAAKSSKKTGAAHAALSKTQKFYRLEKALREEPLTPEDFLRERKALIEPMVDDFKSWFEIRR